MRERPAELGGPLVSPRITPARAGKTSSARRFSISAWDYPRSCGKDSLTRRTKDFILGSPPLVRERPSTDSGKVTVFGITPARAGKTFPHIRNFKQIRDHPRSCGKDHLCHEVVNQLAGSPLLVRERHECLLANKGQSGIAPARAGKTRLS